MLKNIYVGLGLPLLLIGCTHQFVGEQVPIKKEVEIVSWNKLVTTVNTGSYRSIGQQHDKTVRLVLNDGQVIQAQEPNIDDIYKVVKNCKKCLNKPFLTE